MVSKCGFRCPVSSIAPVSWLLLLMMTTTMMLGVVVVGGGCYLSLTGDEKIYKFVGDPDQQQAGIEASLDIQYIMGVAPHLKAEFW